MNGKFNMSLRKFLKQVGVTSQQQIEAAMREAGTEATAGRSFDVQVVLNIEELGLRHEVRGSITGPG